jgi:hypothetical protein
MVECLTSKHEAQSTTNGKKKKKREKEKEIKAINIEKE